VLRDLLATDAIPSIRLTQIHRQAADNPIIHLSMLVRNGGHPMLGDHGNGVCVLSRDNIDAKMVMAADQVLVGMNATRERYNQRLRGLLGRSGQFPVKDDRLVCLKNQREQGLFNGSLWTVAKIKAGAADTHKIRVKSEDTDAVVSCEVLDACWDGTLKDLPWQAKKGFQEFTYGYALTVHKSQGSQWGSVMVFDESGAFGTERSRWLYTAITRAADRLTIVIQ
jgi:exodeoxyribonuclease-5